MAEHNHAKKIGNPRGYKLEKVEKPAIPPESAEGEESPIADLKKGIVKDVDTAMSENFTKRKKDVVDISALTSDTGIVFNNKTKEQSELEIVREVAKNLLKAERPEKPKVPKKEDYSTQEEYVFALEQYVEASQDYDKKVEEYELKLEEAILSLSDAINSMASSELKSLLRQQQFVNMLEEAHIELQDYKIDELSGIWSQNAFNKNIDNIYKYFSERGIPIVLIYLDLDFLKQLNDTYGHEVGDEAIRKIGDILNRNLRTSDLAARVGGEEFNAILTNASLEEGTKVAERIREDIAKEMIPYRPDPNSDFIEYLNISVSVGVAASNYKKDVDEKDKPSFKAFRKRADDALYNSKEKEGRNITSASVINDDGSVSIKIASPEDHVRPAGYKKG